MRNFLTRGYAEKECQLVFRSVRSAQEGCGSCEQRKLTRELPALTLRNDYLSDKTGLDFTIPPFYPGASSAGSCLKMFSHSVVLRTMLRQDVHGLLLRPGEGAGGPVSAQVRKPGGSSVAGYPISAISLGSNCRWRGLGTKASGRRKKGAEMVSGEGFKQRSSKTKRRAVEVPAAHLSSNESTAAEAAVVGLSRDSCGSIHVIVGPMFAGKSTALLHRVQEEASGGRRVALVKSDKDTRFGLSAIVTHDGLQMPCYAVPDLATFKTKIGENFYKELDVIGIDEAQFFADLYQFCQHAADFEGKKVIVAGLDGDFLRRKFGSTLDLVPVADSVVKLSSRCEICGRPAIFSFRKTLDTHTELVGGADVYMPVCRQHFVNGQIVVETASTVIGAHQVAQMNND